jgi:HEAT repeat protein
MSSNLEANSIVDRLDALALDRSWFGRAARITAICSLLQQLSSTNDIQAIPHFVSFLFSPSAQVRAAARTAIAVSVSRLSPIDLLQLPDVFADHQWPPRFPNENLTPHNLRQAASEKAEPVHAAVVGLASFHRNGFVRHEAVRLLSTIDDGTELPFLLIRQNDWVRPIAADAQSAVSMRLNNARLAKWIELLPLVVRLGSCTRYDHSPILRGIVELLFEKQHAELLQRVVTEPETEVRREVVRVALQQECPDQRNLIRLGLDSPDPILRHMCCRAMPHVVDADELLVLVDRLKADRFMPVRKEAIRMLAEKFSRRAVATWQSALFDDNRGIREMAQFYLRQMGHNNLASQYRNALTSDPDSFVALQGLVETGDRSDEDAFRKLLDHRWPSRRCLGLRGMWRFSGGTAVATVLRGLRDPSPGVVREAHRLLASRLNDLLGAELLQAALDAPLPLARRLALHLLSEMSRWRGLPWLIRAAGEADDKTARYADSLIEGWFSPPKCNHVFTKPNAAERAAIDEALAATHDRLSPPIRTLLARELHTD